MEFKNEMFEQNDNMNQSINHQDELSNISLTDSNEDGNANNKKYILLAIALVLLFAITIIIIRFISNSNNDTLIEDTSVNTIKQDNILEGIDPEQKYREIIQKRVETLKQEEQLKAIEAKEDIKMNAPIVTDTEDIQDSVPTKQDKKREKEFKAPTAKTVILNSSNKLDGSFIQLGAFSNYPKKQYINNIKDKNYDVVIHKVEVNGKYYHKVLIGPFESQQVSRSKLSTIREELNSPKAFIYQ